METDNEQIILDGIIDLFKNNQYEEAYKKLNTIKFNKIEKYFLSNLEGLILVNLNKIDAAIICFDDSIKRNPTFSEGPYNAGTVLISQKRFQEAEKYLNRAVLINNQYFEAYFNLSLVYKELNKLDEAINVLNKCLVISPNAFEVYNNIGLIFFLKNNLSDAIFNFKKCIDLNPEYVEAYNNLGLVYLKLNNIKEAIFNFNKVLALKFDHKEANFNLGLTYEKLRKFDQAEIFFNFAIKFDKNFSKAYVHLARLFFQKCEFSECLFLIKRGLVIFQEPEFYEILGDLEMLKGNFLGLLENYNKSLSINTDQPVLLSKLIFNYNYINYDPKDYFNVIDNYKKLLVNLKSTTEVKNISKKPSGLHSVNEYDEIRVGFITSDFREHPIGFQTLSILKELKNFKKMKMYSFYNNNTEDEYTQKIKSSFHYWENIFFIDDSEVVNLIKSLNIDVLVDLNGHTGNHRMGVLIQKPSPIQVTWAGYLASTGISEVDYIVADNFVIPDEKKILYKEKVINLSIWSGLYPEENVYLNRIIPALKNKFITFGSFSNLRKINLSVINLWSRILVTLPDSKLVIRCKELKNLELKEYYISLFAKNLVNKNQLIFIEEVSRLKLLEMYNEIDIALDPFPYNGGTTNFEAAWMCVPILTKIGDTFISRCGGSINKTLGLEDWTCANEEDYFNKAVRFSKDLNYLQLVKNSLIEQRKTSIIFDGKKLASEIYDSFNKLINR